MKKAWTKIQRSASSGFPQIQSKGTVVVDDTSFISKYVCIAYTAHVYTI